jgi:hypothetical protein
MFVKVSMHACERARVCVCVCVCVCVTHRWAKRERDESTTEEQTTANSQNTRLQEIAQLEPGDEAGVANVVALECICVG